MRRKLFTLLLITALLTALLTFQPVILGQDAAALTAEDF